MTLDTTKFSIHERLTPELLVVGERKRQVIGLYSEQKEKILISGGSFHFNMLTDDLVQVWSGRLCGLYSLKKEHLLLPIEHDTIRIDGGTVVIDEHLRRQEIPLS